MSILSKQEIGALGERRAVRYLRLRGYRIKARNWRAGHGELDIIAETLRDIVFVEVKTRTYTPDTLESAPPPHLAVHAEKQRVTRQTAEYYLRRFPTRKQPRMDVMEIRLVQKDGTTPPRVAKIHHIKAAY
ncbi:MAG: YraN family protein [Ruminococcaceae bacterium]|nr:YraN family protein [Oscillospiraceae bacterium]